MIEAVSQKMNQKRNVPTATEIHKKGRVEAENV